MIAEAYVVNDQKRSGIHNAGMKSERLKQEA